MGFTNRTEDSMGTVTIETAPQHMDALAKGNEIRKHRAQFKRDLRTLDPPNAYQWVVDHIADPPAWMTRMELLDIMRNIPSCGPERACIILRRAGIINPVRQVGKMTYRQQIALCGLLHDRTRELEEAAARKRK